MFGWFQLQTLLIAYAKLLKKKEYIHKLGSLLFVYIFILVNIDMILLFFMFCVSEYNSAYHVAFLYFAIGISNNFFSL